MKLTCKYHKDSNTLTLYFPDKFDTTKLANGSVTTTILANNSITTPKILDAAIESVKLATASITAAKVATAAIGSSHLQDALITTAKIANLAVDTSRLADLTITAGKLASSCVEASKIANLAVGAAAIASGAIGTAKIADAAIIEAKIDNAAVTSAKIFDAAIVNAKIADLAVNTAKIANSAITNLKVNDLDASKINTGYLNAARIEAGSIVLGKITGLGDLATENDLDGVSNGTTYSKVLTTAISAGKIVLTSAGVTGTLPTSLSVAKCTDANADQTSAHGQNLGWLIGSTGELTISSGGKMSIDSTDALEITAGGNIKVLAGGDIVLVGHNTNPGCIEFKGSSHSIYLGAKATGAFLRLWPDTTNTTYFQVGLDLTGSFKRFINIQMHSKDYLLFTAKAGANSSSFRLEDDRIITEVPSMYPYQNNVTDLGTAAKRWKTIHGYDVFAETAFKGPLANDGAYIQGRSNHRVSFNWTGSALQFYVDASNVKTFVIQHPVKAEKYLVHGTLEGPEACVFYRGTQKLVNGCAKVLLPNYFEALTNSKGRTIILTMIDGFDKMMIEKQNGEKIKDGMFRVKSENPYSVQEFDWEVKAIRKDVASLNTEPDKNKTQVKGIGPYTYI